DRHRSVKAAGEKEKINEKWEATHWAKKIEARAKAAKMTDIDRYKVMRAKQLRNKIIKHELSERKKEASKKA
ncbi:hypothetical protein scyTo_0026518, partial [Scyliorhinus torazame]|nr:hypothetical protein [Scyliorhinus torazame]